MNLPDNSKLNIGNLSRLFDHMSESYKIFWFKGIVDKVIEALDKGKGIDVAVAYEDLIDLMVVSAWYPVTEYRLNLGPTDGLESLVKVVQAKSKMQSNETVNNILEYLRKSKDDREIKTLKRKLTLHVPYRLQSPFLDELRTKNWSKTNELVKQINLEEGVVYHFFDG
ncbi:MAG: hypothetical protein ACRCUS_05590, partial [Anaerovoracaceae bacterium]